MNTWEGQMAQMKNTTESIVSKSCAEIQSRIDRLSERMILNETNEDIQEREVTSQLNRLAETVSAFKAE